MDIKQDFFDIFEHLDEYIINLMRRYALAMSRFSLAVIFIWFGALKVFKVSPAYELVVKTVYWFDPSWFVPFLGWWEVIIGLCFLNRMLVRPGIFLMALQMVGTFLPLVLLPDIVYGTSIFALTMEGQYVVKNLALIAGAIVVGSHMKTKSEVKLLEKASS